MLTGLKLNFEGLEIQKLKKKKKKKGTFSYLTFVRYRR